MVGTMGRHLMLSLLILAVLFGGFSSASSTPPATKIVAGIVSNVASSLVNWLWSLKASRKAVIAGRSMVKFEGGYTVETVFDGSKLGMEPYAVEVAASGDLLVLDSENSNVYKISTPLSRYSRPKLVAGSPEGYSGHVDGKPREARMNNPKGLAVDDRGNVYVADTVNMAIRKIGDAGVVTIAGGKGGRGGGHVDGPSEDARFSSDFDVVYASSSCSILVVDRGNQAIREIQLREEDCSSQNVGDLHLGIAVLAAAAFFGYMLALLQRRAAALFSSRSVPKANMKGIPPPPYRAQPPVKSVRPPLIPTDEESERQEEGFLGSVGRLLLNTTATLLEILGGSLSGSSKSPLQHQHARRNILHEPQFPNANFPQAWPVQESFTISNEEQPPPLESRDPTPRRAYPFTSREQERTRPSKQTRPSYGGQSGEYFHRQLQQQHHQKHCSSSPQTYYEQSSETANEIVFGAVQEQDGHRGAVVIKAVDYGNPMYGDQCVRSRYNYTGYAYGY